MNHPALLLGNFRRDERVALSVAASQATLDLCIVETLKEASDWMQRNEPAVLLVEDSAKSAEGLCLEARSHARHATVPIMALARDLDDLSFAEAFSWGGDDVVKLSEMRALLARLRALPARQSSRMSAAGRGFALVADGDRTRRVVLARVLQNAGYEIMFAVTPDDTVKFSQDEKVKVVVVSAELHDTPAESVRRGQEGGSQAIWIITAAPRKISEHREALSNLEKAAVTDGFAPPENVVFLANELMRGSSTDNRASRRLLFGTQVMFRNAGSDRDDVGYTYNLSEGGLYVRTLAPPQEDKVWLELTPPRSDRRVRVEGEVVWRRAFGPGIGATVPPGFGVRISDGCAADLDLWKDRYQCFAEVLGLAA
ncbi:MAG: PilZ domain-containing protein [Polyangiaceae bacterium]|nr:PilZ domain-containing protein [Polyangiaceae bacterium]